MLPREFSHFVAGHCFFIPDEGESIDLRSGDAVLFPANCSSEWDIRETVRKSFLIMPQFLGLITRKLVSGFTTRTFAAFRAVFFANWMEFESRYLR